MRGVPGNWLVPVGIVLAITAVSAITFVGNGRNSASSSSTTSPRAAAEFVCPSGESIVAATAAPVAPGAGTATPEEAATATLRDSFVDIGGFETRLRSDSALKATVFLVAGNSPRAEMDVEQASGRWNVTAYRMCSGFAQDHLRR